MRHYFGFIKKSVHITYFLIFNQLDRYKIVENVIVLNNQNLKYTMNECARLIESAADRANKFITTLTQCRASYVLMLRPLTQEI